MSESKHTPAPWRLIPGDDTPGHRESAMVYAGDQLWKNVSRSSRNVEEDARLIAAAPDMLEVLKSVCWVLNACSDAAEFYDKNLGDEIFMSGVHEKIKAALRKAGHTPDQEE